jgi:hypothetical protein
MPRIDGRAVDGVATVSAEKDPGPSAMLGLTLRAENILTFQPLSLKRAIVRSIEQIVQSNVTPI